MRFDLILTNPPFQDSENRGKTHHKLWIDFTLHTFNELLREGGSLVQVSPASFASPSNPVLELMKQHETRHIRLDTQAHFPQVASTFSDYWIVKSPTTQQTIVESARERFSCVLDTSVEYLPNDWCKASLSIHRKVMFETPTKLDVRWDYVTCHNVLRSRKPEVLNESQTDTHVHPVFHTNRSTWFSSVRQSWATLPKVMWTRSGYTRPFFDNGRLGGTDMVYYVPVASEDDGSALVHNLKTSLFQYIFQTARWSGFGHERVFQLLPDLAPLPPLSDAEMFAQFAITDQEAKHVCDLLS